MPPPSEIRKRIGQEVDFVMAVNDQHLLFPFILRFYLKGFYSSFDFSLKLVSGNGH